MAHIAGNNLGTLATALRYRADVIEIDVISARGELAAGRNKPSPSLDEIVAFLAQRAKSRQVMIASGDQGALRYLHSRLPDVTLLFSVGGPDALHQLQTDAVLQNAIGGATVFEGLVDTPLLVWAHQRKLKILAWTVNDSQRFNQLVRLGVDGITRTTWRSCRRSGERSGGKSLRRVSDRAATVRGDGGGWPLGHPRKGGDMTEYLIAFNDEWAPDHTLEELRGKSKAVKALVAEMRAAGVFVFLGGLDPAAPVFSVDASSGTPLFTDGPFVESKEHLGGFTVVDVADEEAARMWAGKIAVACGWPQEVRRFQVPMELPETP